MQMGCHGYLCPHLLWPNRKNLLGECVHGVTVAGPSSVSGSAKGVTRSNPILGRVYKYILRGWRDQVPKALKPFESQQSELTIEGGCILWGIRAIVPNKLRQAMLDMLHDGHQGIVRMKSLAHSYVWWPGLDDNLKKLAKECSPCQQVQKAFAVAPLHPWLWPDKPWAQVHLDGFCRSLHGTHLPHCSGCTLQVARGGADAYHHFGSHNHHSETDVLSLWPTATTHHRQWPTVYFIWICNCGRLV